VSLTGGHHRHGRQTNHLNRFTVQRHRRKQNVSDNDTAVFYDERNDRRRVLAKRVNKIRLRFRFECCQVDGPDARDFSRLLGSDAHDSLDSD
jgi:hypothetical protein